MCDSGYAVLEVQHRGSIAMIDTLKDQWTITEEWYILRSSHAIGRSTVAMGAVDLLRAAEVVRADSRFTKNISICGVYYSALSSLYAGALDSGIGKAMLFGLPYSHLFDGKFVSAGGYKLVYNGKTKAPYLMNVLKYCDVPQALALMAPRKVTLSGVDSTQFAWTRSIYNVMGASQELTFGNANTAVKTSANRHSGLFDPFIIYPFPSHTKIAFMVHESNRVNVSVFNAFGERVKTLVNDMRIPGPYEAYWDGTDDNGGKVSDGLYFCRLNEGQKMGVKRMAVK
jgi:hypothetical protein